MPLYSYCQYLLPVPSLSLPISSRFVPPLRLTFRAHVMIAKRCEHYILHSRLRVQRPQCRCQISTYLPLSFTPDCCVSNHVCSTALIVVKRLYAVHKWATGGGERGGAGPHTPGQDHDGASHSLSLEEFRPADTERPAALPGMGAARRAANCAGGAAAAPV